MDPAPKARIPPRVVRVPPPDAKLVATRPISACAITGILSVVLVASAGLVSKLLILVALGVGAVIFWWPHQINRNYRRQRAELLATLGTSGPDPLADAIAAKWARPFKDPKPRDIRAALRAAIGGEPECAHVVFLGMIDVPDVADVFFEPEIITPTRAIGNRLWFAPAAVVILTFMFLRYMGVIRGDFSGACALWFVLAIGLWAGGAWIWRSAIRPTYIRMAPGIIQVMEYRHGRGAPTIRSYTPDAGTLVVIRAPVSDQRPARLSVTLLRGDNKDTLNLAWMRECHVVIERTLQALLSTAPTPPLSDEELIG